MSTWTEFDPFSSDVGDDLCDLARVLTGSAGLRSEGHGVFLFAPIEPVLDGRVDATLTLEDEDVEPDRAAMLIVPEAAVDAVTVLELLDGIPDPPLAGDASVWLCERSEAPAQATLEVRVPGRDSWCFALHRLRPLPKARPPSPVPEKRAEGPGNLRRRADWFQSGTRRRR